MKRGITALATIALLGGACTSTSPPPLPPSTHPFSITPFPRPTAKVTPRSPRPLAPGDKLVVPTPNLVTDVLAAPTDIIYLAYEATPNSNRMKVLRYDRSTGSVTGHSGILDWRG